MEASLKRLSKIDTKTRYTVHGWVRNMEKKLKLAEIPTMLISICILFYEDNDRFDRVGSNLKLLKDGTCLKVIKSTPHRWILEEANCGYGAIQIPSKDTSIYRWDLKFRSSFSCEFGIDSSAGYFYNLSFSNQRSAKISLILDLKTSDIKYSINNNTEKSMYKGFTRGDDITFRFKIYLKSKGQSVELLHFSKTQ